MERERDRVREWKRERESACLQHGNQNEIQIETHIEGGTFAFYERVAAADQVKRELIEICCADIDNKQCQQAEGETKRGRGDGGVQGETLTAAGSAAVDRLLG